MLSLTEVIACGTAFALLFGLRYLRFWDISRDDVFDIFATIAKLDGSYHLLYFFLLPNIASILGDKIAVIIFLVGYGFIATFSKKVGDDLAWLLKKCFGDRSQVDTLPEPIQKSLPIIKPAQKVEDGRAEGFLEKP
jgi:hypothetical protein